MGDWQKGKMSAPHGMTFSLILDDHRHDRLRLKRNLSKSFTRDIPVELRALHSWTIVAI